MKTCFSAIRQMEMHRKMRYIAAVTASLSLLFAGCAGGPANDGGEDKETLQFQGIALYENSVLVTESAQDQLPSGQLIALDFPEGAEAPAIGSLYQYKVGSALRESWPVQGTVIEMEEVEAFAGTTVISFETADAILQHLPQNAYLIDVRTTEEYEGGHVSGAQNISVDQIETAILTAVPDMSDVIIVYCRSGNRSAQAAKLLEEMGYKVILDAGGINDYKGELVVVGSAPKHLATVSYK